MEAACGKVNRTGAESAMACVSNLIYVYDSHSFPGFASLIDRHSEQPSHGQAHVPPPQQASHQETWFSYSHGRSVGTRGSQPPSQEGSQAADGSFAKQIFRRITACRDRTGSRGRRNSWRYDGWGRGSASSI